MPTKEQFRKYINDIKKCERIEVFVDPDLGPDRPTRWLHFIGKGRKFLGFDLGFPKNPLEVFVSSSKDYMVRHSRSQLSDPNLYAVRRMHVKSYQRDGAIVLKNGKWTWVK